MPVPCKGRGCRATKVQHRLQNRTFRQLPLLWHLCFSPASWYITLDGLSRRCAPRKDKVIPSSHLTTCMLHNLGIDTQPSACWKLSSLFGAAKSNPANLTMLVIDVCPQPSSCGKFYAMAIWRVMVALLMMILFRQLPPLRPMCFSSAS